MQKMITILGPTASGKTPVAARLAEEIGGEVISADSRQVYRRMDIGTGKDLEDYGSVPYHLILVLKQGPKGRSLKIAMTGMGNTSWIPLVRSRSQATAMIALGLALATI